jgi:S1-C subfamily serine protease
VARLTTTTTSSVTPPWSGTQIQALDSSGVPITAGPALPLWGTTVVAPITLTLNHSTTRYRLMTAAHGLVEATLLGVDAETGCAAFNLAQPVALAPQDSATDIDPGSAVTVLSSNGNAPVSATVKSVSATARLAGGQQLEQALVLATSAPVDSAAVVVDPSGSVVAMSMRDAQGRTVAVPIDLLQASARSIASKGKVSNPWLGITGTDLTSTAAQALGITSGVLVSTAAPQTPAGVAGLREGDIITAIDGRHVKSMATLNIVLHNYDPGDQISLTVLRGGTQLLLPVMLAAKQGT